MPTFGFYRAKATSNTKIWLFVKYSASDMGSLFDCHLVMITDDHHDRHSKMTRANVTEQQFSFNFGGAVIKARMSGGLCGATHLLFRKAMRRNGAS